MTETASIWPAPYQGAISLTFDDGMPSQLRTAVPLLNTLNLQGTFYLNLPDGYMDRMAAWSEVAAAGHELGNHTVNHPCSCNNFLAPVPDRRILEKMTLDEIEWEIVEAGRRILTLAPNQTATSYAYTCYHTFVGRGEQRQSYVPVVARHCVAGRGRGEEPYANDPLHCDLAHLWSWPCERKTGAEMIGLVEQAVDQGLWGILTFHGVDGGHLTVAERDFHTLCSFLSRHRERIWVAPVATIAGWLADRRTDITEEIAAQDRH